MSQDLKTLFPSFRKYWHYSALAFGLSMLAAIFEGFSLGLLIPFLQALSDSGTGGFQTGIEWIDVYLLATDAPQIERLYRICGLILVATWMRSICGYFSSVSMAMARGRIIQDLRQRVVDRLLTVAYSFYSQMRAGDVFNSVANEVSRAASTLSALFGFAQQGFLIAVYAVFMFVISWELSLMTAVTLIALGGGLTVLIRVVKDRGQEITRAGAAFSIRIAEFLSGVRTVVAYNTQDYERDRLHHAARRAADSIIDTAKYQSLVGPISQSVASSTIIVLVLISVQYYVIPGYIEFAFLLTFLFALFRLMPVVHSINGLRGTWAQNRPGLTNVADLIRMDNKPRQTSGDRNAHPLSTGIEFADVSFSYVTGNPVLANINAHIQQGATTAIVGASGAGKSTLADLIPRFYDPTEGRILYDGVDLREFDVHSLRDRIGIVSQSSYMFNDTVRANISYGSPDATMEDIYEAARTANALSFIEGMEDGFNTMLGDRGTRLSGGQRQRLAIARALVQNPEILILDEATSDLDSVSEQLVKQSLDRLMEGRTVIAIAHRLSTIENADWVLVLEDGRIAEEGRYHDLIDQRGHLWEYHKIQYHLA